MHFVALRKLKQQLRVGELPPIDVACYIAAQAALGALLFVPSPADAPLDWDLVTFPLLGLGGVFYCYRSNGASGGVRFAERYLALGWVVGWRTALTACTVITLGFLAGLLSGGFAWLKWLEHERIPTALSAATFALIAFIYWRIGVHLQDLNAGTGAVNPQDAGLPNPPQPTSGSAQ